MAGNMPNGHKLVNACRASRPEKYAQSVVERPPRFAHDALMQHLKRLRMARQLTQAQLAQAVGCNQGTISKLERGGKNVTLEMIERIARRLDVEPWELFGIDGVRQRYLEALSRAPAAKREAVLLLLEGSEPSQ